MDQAAGKPGEAEASETALSDAPEQLQSACRHAGRIRRSEATDQGERAHAIAQRMGDHGAIGAAARQTDDAETGQAQAVGKFRDIDRPIRQTAMTVGGAEAVARPVDTYQADAGHGEKRRLQP